MLRTTNRAGGGFLIWLALLLGSFSLGAGAERVVLEDTFGPQRESELGARDRVIGRTPDRVGTSTWIDGGRGEQLHLANTFARSDGYLTSAESPHAQSVLFPLPIDLLSSTIDRGDVLELEATVRVGTAQWVGFGLWNGMEEATLFQNGRLVLLARSGGSWAVRDFVEKRTLIDGPPGSFSHDQLTIFRLIWDPRSGNIELLIGEKSVGTTTSTLVGADEVAGFGLTFFNVKREDSTLVESVRLVVRDGEDPAMIGDMGEFLVMQEADPSTQGSRTSSLASLRAHSSLPDASFEVGLGGWRARDLYGPGLLVSRTKDAVDGNVALRLTKPDPASTAWLDSPDLHWPNSEVELTFHLRGGPEFVGEEVQVQLTGPSWSGEVRHSHSIQISEDWQKYTLLIPAIPSSDNPLRLRWRLPTRLAGWIEIDDVRLWDAQGRSLVSDQPAIDIAWEDDMPLIYPGDSASMTITVAPWKGQTAPHVLVEVTDENGKSIDFETSEWVVNNKLATWTLTFHPQVVGWFSVHVGVAKKADLTPFWTTELAFACVHKPELGTPWLGVMDESHSWRPEARRMEKLGIELTRFGAAEAWHVTARNPEAESVPFQGLETALRDHNIQTVATLQGVPHALLAQPRDDARTAGRRHRVVGLEWNPQLAEKWQGYVESVGRNFSEIAAYESWNESNAASYYLGSTQVIAEMLAINRRGLDQVGAEAPLLGPTVAMLPVPYVRRVLEQLEPGTVDGVSIHPYRTGPGRPEDTGYLTQLDNLKANLNEVGMPDLQIWVTELGWIHTDITPAPVDRGATVTRSTSETANYILRSFIIGLTRGLDRQYYFRWRDDSNIRLPSYFGLFNPDSARSPKLSLLAISALQNLFTSAQFETILHEKAPWFAYQFRKGDQHIIAAWTHRGMESVRLETPAGTPVRILDRFAREKSASSAGQWIVLREEPQFFILPASAPVRLQAAFQTPDKPLVLVPGSDSVNRLTLDGFSGNVERIQSENGPARFTTEAELLDETTNEIRFSLRALPDRERAGPGFATLKVDTDSGILFTTIPVDLVSGPMHSKPISLDAPEATWSIRSSVSNSTLDWKDGVAHIRINPAVDHFSTHWTGAAIAVPSTDISAMEALAFEILVDEPSPDLFLSINLVDVDGARFTSWHTPDVLNESKGWRTIRIPLRDFAANGLFAPISRDTIPPLDAIDKVEIVMAGNDPGAHLSLKIRNARLQPKDGSQDPSKVGATDKTAAEEVP